MALGTPYVTDLAPQAVNGVISNLSTSAMTTLYGAGNIKTPSAEFSFIRNGHTIHLTKGVPMVVDAAFITFLTSIGAPVT